MAYAKLRLFFVLLVATVIGITAAMRISEKLVEAKIAQDNYWGNEADMIGYFEGAKTPEMELAAAKTLNERFPGYSVRAFDRSGTEFIPSSKADYDAIDRVIIEFPGDNDVATRKIQNRKSINAIYLLD